MPKTTISNSSESAAVGAFVGCAITGADTKATPTKSIFVNLRIMFPSLNTFADGELGKMRGALMRLLCAFRISYMSEILPVFGQHRKAPTGALHFYDIYIAQLS